MSDKPTCFVVMGFREQTDPISGKTFDLDKSYRILIKPAVEAAGATCVRADEIVHAPRARAGRSLPRTKTTSQGSRDGTVSVIRCSSSRTLADSLKVGTTMVTAAGSGTSAPRTARSPSSSGPVDS